MKDFVDLVKNNYENSELILKAFDFACEAHKNMKRRSGEPYIIHPVAVAKILIDFKVNEEIVLGYQVLNQDKELVFSEDYYNNPELIKDYDVVMITLKLIK